MRALLESSSAPLVASVARCARRVLGPVDSSLRSSPSLVASILSRLEPLADRLVAADVAGLSTTTPGLVTARDETGACALPGAAPVGVIAVLGVIAVPGVVAVFGVVGVLVVVAAAF